MDYAGSTAPDRAGPETGGAAIRATDAAGLCRELLAATKALHVAATDSDDVLVEQVLRRRAALLAALDGAGPLSPSERRRCLELLRQTQELEQEARRRLEDARADVLAELRTLHGGRHALHAYRAAARPAPASLCLDQNG